MFELAERNGVALPWPDAAAAAAARAAYTCLEVGHAITTNMRPAMSA